MSIPHFREAWLQRRGKDWIDVSGWDLHKTGTLLPAGPTLKRQPAWNRTVMDVHNREFHCDEIACNPSRLQFDLVNCFAERVFCSHPLFKSLCLELLEIGDIFCILWQRSLFITFAARQKLCRQQINCAESNRKWKITEIEMSMKLTLK